MSYEDQLIREMTQDQGPLEQEAESPNEHNETRDVNRGRDLRVFESTGHGKNIKGNKRTSTIQVREYGIIQDAYLLVKQFSFKVGDKIGRLNATFKAHEYVRQNRFNQNP